MLALRVALALAVATLTCGCSAPDMVADGSADAPVADDAVATPRDARDVPAAPTDTATADAVAAVDAIDAVTPPDAPADAAAADEGTDVVAPPPDAAPDVACAPACAGRVCGPDGCGGSCGACASGRACSAAGQCVSTCTPACSRRVCGTDGCGGSCGTCPSGRTCSAAGQCVSSCTPSCAGRSCGGDGCGGSCGACGTNASCNATGNCQCNAGFYPSPAGTFCIPPTGSCAGTGVSSSGYCADSANWIWCDPVYGLRRMDCAGVGLGGCSTPPGGGGGGACRCSGPSATVTTTGSCGTIGGPPSWDGMYRCNAAFGVIYPVNCRDGNPGGFCTTWATGFGSGPSCMCGSCNPYDTVRRVCLGSPCSAGCAIVPATTSSPGIHACR